MSKKGGKFKNIRPSAHDYQHLPKRQKDRYDALDKLDDAALEALKARAKETLVKCETEIKLIRLVRRDRSRTSE